MSSDPKLLKPWSGKEENGLEEVKEAKEGMSSPPFKLQAWKPASPTGTDRIRQIGHPGPLLAEAF